jgi:RsiW-degrading membrane proteinase PrsW (M82 family)
MNPISIALLSCVLSLIPTILWGMLFLYKHEEKKILLIKTYIYGGLMVVPLVFYRTFFQFSPENMFFGFLPSMLVLFVTIAFLEEFLKHLVTRQVDHNEIQSIDDAIEFSIVAALGFAFAENTFYFIEVYQSLGKEVFYQTIILRSLFATFAHSLFSSIYGYYYGKQIFAKQIYEQEIPKRATGIFKRIARFIHSINPYKIFQNEMRLLGLLFASIVHATYNILLEMDFVNFLLPFMCFGLYFIFRMIWSKKNHILYKKTP